MCRRILRVVPGQALGGGTAGGASSLFCLAKYGPFRVGIGGMEGEDVSVSFLWRDVACVSFLPGKGSAVSVCRGIRLVPLFILRSRDRPLVRQVADAFSLQIVRGRQNIRDPLPHAPGHASSFDRTVVTARWEKANGFCPSDCRAVRSRHRPGTGGLAGRVGELWSGPGAFAQGFLRRLALSLSNSS